MSAQPPPDHPLPPVFDAESAALIQSEAMVAGRQEYFLRFVLSPKQTLAAPWEYGATDYDRARYFLAHFGEHLRYVPERKQWRVWASGWNPDDTDTRVAAYAFALRKWCISQMAAEETRLTEEVMSVGEPAKGALKELADKLKKMKSIADMYGDMAKIEGMLHAAHSFDSITRPESLWNTDPYTVGVSNGVLDLYTRKFGSAKVTDYITKYLGTSYSPGATCPKWMEFMQKIQPGEDLRNYLQALAGYTLTGDVSDQGFYFLYGKGANGKSVFLRMLAELMGDYAEQGRRNLLEESRMSDPKHDLAMLPGVRFLYCEETSVGGKLREETLKALTGGEKVVGEAKYEKPVAFQPMCKLWIAGNHRPAVEGTDLGIWRRVRLIPFSTTIADHEKIPYMEMVETLRAELPGILNWALDGLDRWRPNMMPAEVSAAVAEYKADEDDLADFVADCLVPAPGKLIDRSSVYMSYRAWAESQGVRTIWSAKRFNRHLGERPGFTSTTRKNWVGWMLRPETMTI